MDSLSLVGRALLNWILLTFSICFLETRTKGTSFGLRYPSTSHTVYGSRRSSTVVARTLSVRPASDMFGPRHRGPVRTQRRNVPSVNGELFIKTLPFLVWD